ncbi:MAG: hypothetical protein HYU48_00520 [Candidatus Levybacteria bacterium]|nr:hypothetical protein [Candidatus Levybacteria bacterium]
MREHGLGLPDGELTANYLDALYKRGDAPEVLLKGPLSDICHDEVLIQCLEVIDPAFDHTVNALAFLSKFCEVRERLTAFYSGLGRFPALEAKAIYFRNMMPSSMAARTQQRIAEVSGDGSEREDLIQLEEFINGIAQEANQVFQRSLEEKSRRF